VKNQTFNLVKFDPATISLRRSLQMSMFSQIAAIFFEKPLKILIICEQNVTFAIVKVKKSKIFTISFVENGKLL
jgi:hypothetical protein